MKLVPALLMTVGSVLLSAQAPIAFSPGIEAARGHFEKGFYFKGNEALAALAFGPDGQVRDQMAFALWKQFNPYLTNELDLNTRALSGHASKPNAEWVTRILAAEPRDAIEEIVARARNTNVVILNEAHSSPRDRAFALRVARALRPLGYKTLAAETFANDQPENGPSATDQLKRDGFVRFGTGAYTLDPVFARFIREALAMGYEPVAYEQTKAQNRPTGGIGEREQAQAENLMQRIFSARPKDKVLIYVGLGHVAERPGKHGEMMAARLKRMTGVDPLTIDQAGVTDTDVATREAYAAASARVGRRPAVFFEGNDPLLIGRITGVDLQVIHPPRSYQSGRPTWLVELGGKQLPIPKHLLPTEGRRLIQVFAANAPRDAVPLDQVSVNGVSSSAVLIVPPGPVRYAIQQ